MNRLFLLLLLTGCPAPKATDDTGGTDADTDTDADADTDTDTDSGTYVCTPQSRETTASIDDYNAAAPDGLSYDECQSLCASAFDEAVEWVQSCEAGAIPDTAGVETVTMTCEVCQVAVR